MRDLTSDETLEFLANPPKDYRQTGWVCERLGMSRQGVLAAIRRGDLDAVRLTVPLTNRSVYLVRKRDVDKFLRTPRKPGPRPKR